MTTLTVGTGSGFDYGTLAGAIAASGNGDVIRVQAGTYTNDFATITTSIAIEGVGGMVNLVATEAPPNRQGILTIGTPGATGPDVTLYNMSFSSAAISGADGANAAGIRYKSGNLTLNNTDFTNNQDGLLADADPTGNITINNSQFAENGGPSGQTHNLYVGGIQQLTIDNSYFYDPLVGHDIKSRAANTTIEDSRIDDPNGTGSYEIDLPNGGNAVIRDNVIDKGAGAHNANFISFGAEGGLHAGSTLSVTGNTVINDYGSNANLLVNDTNIPASVTGNTAYGLKSTQIAEGPVATPETNTLAPQSSEPPLDTSAAYLPVASFSFACFAAGTCILTTDGPVPVEALRVGQEVVVVRSDNETPGQQGTRSIHWIGHRHIDLARHADAELARPIRIRADAFADGVPLRDLLLSPDHAIYLDGLLIPVRLLQNGATIVREDRLRAVRYFHVELDRHDILLAEGLATESYLDTGNRWQFENVGRSLLLHPDLTADDGQARRELFSCAPFTADAARVEPVWRRLADRASQLGHVIADPATTSDPALRLLVDGQERWPVTTTDGCHIFVLPQSAASVRLISRATAPCHVMPWIEDRRRLGVAVGRIVLTSPTEACDMPADHPSLTEGWWPHERDGSRLWRWTDGNAMLPLPPGVAIVEVHLAGENTYQLAAEANQAVTPKLLMVA
ncbi:Hint domain-containing protein [Rhodopila sp.]|uniref:Hint domain-containing protein n=1 Tax=Rhodopila sp. TaxID=2480087 RepID=UPI003D0BB427